MGRKDTRSFSEGTTSSFPKAGDSEAEVVNVSGAPSPNTIFATQNELGMDTEPSKPLPHRQAVQINADTGQLYSQATRNRAQQVWSSKIGTVGNPGYNSHLASLLGLDAGQELDHQADDDNASEVGNFTDPKDRA
jgi:hypothetical protein